MIFSDRTIVDALEAGRIGIDPFDRALVQPSSVDIRCDHRFRVFENHRYSLIDPGFSGQVTLELSNVANLPIAIYPEMKIGQISFYELTTAAEHPYGSTVLGFKYQGQTGPTASKMHRDFEGTDDG